MNAGQLKRLMELDLLREIDLVDEAKKADDVPKLLEGLSEDEKRHADAKLQNVADGYKDMLAHIADALEDPKSRAEIVEEWKRRLG